MCSISFRMTDLQASVVDDSGYTLPPGWEAVESDKDHRIYYWNKKTGATTWKFPEHEGEVWGGEVRGGEVWGGEVRCGEGR